MTLRSSALAVLLSLLIVGCWNSAGSFAEEETLKKGGYVSCAVNIENIAKWTAAFHTEKHRFPKAMDELLGYIAAKTNKPPRFLCPVAGRDTYSGTYRVRQGVLVYCAGKNHLDAGFGPNTPCFPKSWNNMELIPPSYVELADPAPDGGQNSDD